MTDAEPDKFEQDRRYGVYVRFMKMALPIVSLLILVVLAFTPLFSNADKGFTLDFTELKEFDDTIRMVAPNYTGTDKRGRQFEIKAESAYQNAEQGDRIHLDLLSADITLQKGGWIALDSLSGAYQPEAELVDLSGQVNIFSDIGYEAHSRTMKLDLVLGVASSNEHVYGQGPFGVFEGGGMEVDLDGNYVYLTDGITMTVYPRLAK